MGVPDLLLIIGLPTAAVAAAVFFGWLVPRIRRARQRDTGITLAVFSDASIVAPPRPTRPPATNVVATPPVAPPRTEPTDSPYAPPRREAATGTLGGTAWAEPSVVQDAPRLRLETTVERPAPVADTKPARRATRPMDGTLQFLQGRFEVVEGREIGQEIRFVRQPGSAQTEVTFGRQDGVQYRHVQLHEPTVSRLHAKLTQEDKDWRLTNLSATNPASVNGKPLPADNGSVVLRDGDRVEMGEVVFRFRAK